MKDRNTVGGTAWTLWRVRKTIFQMCHDRGYMVTEKELEEPLDEFLSKFAGERDFNDQLTILLEHQFDPNNQITVFFPKSSEIGRGDVFQFSKSMHEKNISKAIIIVDKSITPSALQFIQVLAPRMFIEVFYENELLVNITEHKCVPDHFLLTPEEKQELLEKYSVREHQLKGILVTDPVSRYYGAKRGQVFRIVRPSETGGRYVEYRVVI